MTAQSNKKSLFLLVTSLLFGVMFLFINFQAVHAASMKTIKKSAPCIVEQIRLSVPSKNRRAWLMAEEKTWKPWLAQKDGFLDRQLLWDRHKEEATLLIRWSTRERWKSIPKSEIGEVQELFENVARDLTGQDSGNPFPITYEGELLPQ